MTVLDDEAIAALFRSSPTFALVGASSSPERDSFDVMDYLLEQGFRVIPVNPEETEVLGQKAYPSLAEVPEPIDVVLVFRRSEYAAEVAASSVAAGAKVLWLTLGVASAEAAAIASAAGLGTVEDRCAKATHKLLKRAEMI
jgi:uncharacterized protein